MVSVSSCRNASISFISINIYISLSLSLASSSPICFVGQFHGDCCSMFYFMIEYIFLRCRVRPSTSDESFGKSRWYWYLMNYYCCFRNYPNEFFLFRRIEIIQFDETQIEPSEIVCEKMSSWNIFWSHFDLFMSKKSVSREEIHDAYIILVNRELGSSIIE